MDQLGFSWDPAARQELTVGELTEHISDLMSRVFPDVWVTGEISGAKLSTAGHWYFNLKEGGAQIRCACFRMQAMRLRVKPQDGLAVVVRGRVEVYAARGEYQLVIETIQARGAGTLQAAFEALKQKLSAEGLFDPERKRELPKFPHRIGIVTSAQGAVVHDLVKILRRRHSGLHVRIYPALVQGEGSVEQVTRGIRYFAAGGWAEVLIVARGGGSLEDLWTFNEERVARAIAGSMIPVVSAIGHQTDFTIADFVSDLRAPTPSAAAELVTQHWIEVANKLDTAHRHLLRGMQLILMTARERSQRRGKDRLQVILRRRINQRSQRLDELDARLARQDVRRKFHEAKLRLERLDTAALHAIRKYVTRLRPKVESLEASVRHLSPLRVLERGYAILESPHGIVRSANSVAEGDPLKVRVADGEFKAVVTAKSGDYSRR